MRNFVILLALLLIAPQPAAATGGDGQEKEASVVFWDFAKCIVERNPDAVRKLLAKPNWQIKDQSLARSLAQSSMDVYPLGKEPCGLFESLGFKFELFRGTLAGAMFVRNTNSKSLSNYASIPAPVTSADLASANDEATQLQLGLRAFSYCVFLNRPNDVRALLVSRPFSQAEHTLFDSLATTFGGCLPATEGTHMSFTHVKLRALLGEAAYYADLNLQSHTSAGTSQ
jgi:hypothetical protein